MTVEILNRFLYWMARFYYVVGFAFMLVPLLTRRPDLSYYLIPGGVVISLLGIMLMGPKEPEFYSNEDILDENIFEEETQAE